MSAPRTPGSRRADKNPPETPDGLEAAKDTLSGDAATIVDGRHAGPMSVSCSVEQALGLSHQAPPAPGQTRGTPRPDVRYEDEGEIGRGGMGTVRRTFDRVLMRAVAMKLIEPSVVSSDLGARFVEEAQITGQLDHPNIVPVYEFGLADQDRAYFTMKLVSGKTLSQVIADLHKSDGRDDDGLERVLRIMLKVCEAVAFAHSRGVVHRDLKPANIMIGSHGQVYVMDWGLGLLLAGQPTTGAAGAPAAGQGQVQTATTRPRRGGGLEGTVAYMAPEQALGNTAGIDARTDVFALGAILYEILTGRPPFLAATQTAGLLLAAAADVKPPEEAATRALPPGLCDITMRALRRHPSERYQTVDEMHAAIEAFLRGGGWFATRRFQPGEVIVREGEAADAAFVIVQGRCEAYRERNGEKARLRLLEPGEVFGETALLNAQPRTASVAAVDEVVVKVVTAEAFERELSRSTWMGALVRQLAARFLEIERRQG